MRGLRPPKPHLTRPAVLTYLTIPVTPFQQNCSLIWDQGSRQAAVIDPGGDLDRLLAGKPPPRTGPRAPRRTRRER